MLPIILEGQMYYDEEKNDYLVVTKKNGESITYQGQGFKGMLEDEIFVSKFQPVDPLDLTKTESAYFKDLCNNELKTGFIQEAV